MNRLARKGTLTVIKHQLLDSGLLLKERDVAGLIKGQCEDKVEYDGKRAYCKKGVGEQTKKRF